MHLLLTLILLSTCALVPHAYALDTSDFDDLIGWTVGASTQVEDDFEGCDFDKQIRFTNGWTLTCSSYSYSYSFMPHAVIFIKSFSHQGKNYWMIKALIDDEFYDMQPVRAK